jgi:hypothetical protein
MTIAQHREQLIRISLKFLLICLILILMLVTGASIVRAQFEDNWSEPLNLSQSGSASIPLMVLDSNGIFHLLWVDEFSGYIYVTGDGVEWSTPTAVVMPFEEVIPYLLADSDGKMHVFWRDDEEALNYSQVEASAFQNSSAWTAPIQLGEAALDFSAVEDGNGDIHLSYVRPLESEEFPAGIYYRRLSAGSGTWSPSTPLYLSPYLRSIELADSNVEITSSMVGDEVHIYVAWDNRPRERVYLSKSYDGGLSWNPPEEVDKPEEGSLASGPSSILVDAKEDNVLVIWQSSRTESSCEQFYQFSEDSGNSWSPRLRMFEGFTTCPNSVQIFHTGEETVLLQKGVQILLQAWNGEMWSDPQPQQALATFIDPETQNYVEFGCQQGILTSDNEFYIAGCDLGAGKDIWLTQNQLLDLDSWFPLEAVWNPVVKVTGNENRISEPVLITDQEQRMHAIWSQSDNNGLDSPGTALYYARWEDGKWSQPEMILASPMGKADQPAAGIDGSDQLYVTWSGGLDGEIYISSAEASQAVVPSSWSDPEQIPSLQKAGSAPSILIEPDGIINIAYAIPLNENRGIYLVRSEDGGSTWSNPIQIFNAEETGWAMVDAPRLAITENGHLHILWTRYTMPSGPGPLSLMYSRSEDHGISWSEARTVVDKPVIWSQIIGTGDQTVQRIWQETSSTGTTLWHEQSSDDGENWIRTVPVSVFGDTVGTPSLTRDSAGRLHLLLVIHSGTNKFDLQHWLYDGERWSAERSLGMSFISNTNISSVEGDVSEAGNLGVLVSDLTSIVDNSTQEYEIMFSNRLLEIPEVNVTPEEQNTPQPQFTPTAVDELQPTKTQSPVAATPTGTPIVIQNEPEPAYSSNWIAIAGPIAIGLIVLIVIVIIFRGIRNWR